MCNFIYDAYFPQKTIFNVGRPVSCVCTRPCRASTDANESAGTRLQMKALGFITVSSSSSSCGRRTHRQSFLRNFLKNTDCMILYGMMCWFSMLTCTYVHMWVCHEVCRCLLLDNSSFDPTTKRFAILLLGIINIIVYCRRIATKHCSTNAREKFEGHIICPSESTAINDYLNEYLNNGLIC